MTEFSPMQSAREAFENATESLAELDANCCVPARSPRMADISADLDKVKKTLLELEASSGSIDPLIERLEAIGAKVGDLQIDCCAPSRMPLYAEMLTSLNKIQRSVRLATKQTMH